METVASPAAASSSTAIAVALGAVAISTAVFCWRSSRRSSQEDRARNAGGDSPDDDDAPEVRENWAIPPDMIPPDGVFTLDSLKKFNGRELPMCLALCGKVVNVSSSLNFTPDAGYGKLWAGSETTYSMAKVSLKPEDANKLDFSLNDFSDQERTALAGWYKHFTTKYPAIGTLKEFDDWDFSTVLKEAETQTPFGAGKTESTEVAAKPEAVPAAAKPEVAPEAKPKADDVVAAEKGEPVVPDGGVVLRRGMRVTISGLEQRAELNGSMAILEDYVPDKQRFAVKLESTGETVLMKPASLKPAAS